MSKNINEIKGTACEFCENRVEFNGELHCTKAQCDYFAVNNTGCFIFDFEKSINYFASVADFCEKLDCPNRAKCERLQNTPLAYEN